MLLNRQINPDSQRLLHRIYRYSRHHQTRQRAHCLLLYHQGLPIDQLMTILMVSQKTVYNWLNEWDQRGFPGLYDRPGRGRKPTFNAEQCEQIRAWARQYPHQLKQIAVKIQETWDIQVSTDTIKRVLKSLQVSWHRLRLRVAGQADPQVYAQKAFTLELLKQLDTIGVLALYYMDESGFSLVPKIPYGWQGRGETITIPSQRSAQLNVLGFMRRQGTLESYVSEQSITGDVVAACIDAFFPQVDKPTVIVMDQAPMHKGKVMQNKLDEWKARNIHIFELPTYSPELNLIEILWRFMKYDWMDISAYRSWPSFVEHVEKMLCGFGEKFVINFT